MITQAFRDKQGREESIQTSEQFHFIGMLKLSNTSPQWASWGPDPLSCEREQESIVGGNRDSERHRGDKAQPAPLACGTLVKRWRAIGQRLTLGNFQVNGVREAQSQGSA